MEAIATILHRGGFFPIPKWRKEAMNNGPLPSIKMIVHFQSEGIQPRSTAMTPHGPSPARRASKHAAGLLNRAAATTTTADRDEIVARTQKRRTGATGKS